MNKELALDIRTDWFKKYLKQWKGIIRPDFEKAFENPAEDKQILMDSIKRFTFTMLNYVGFYLCLFLIGYRYYSALNEQMVLGYTKKGITGLGTYLNLYPFNVIYLVFALILTVGFLSIFTYLFLVYLEDVKPSFIKNLSAILNSVALVNVLLFPFLLINALFPFDKPIGTFGLGVYVGALILVLAVGFVYSAVIYIRSMHWSSRQNYRRALLAWIVSFGMILFFVSRILGK
ncbi:hypothetical protein LPTSP4_35930 [Leptospira ryugenii]|uniref:Yip1 domain-containing protein n=1 Tax=Leptospira ryugenii TaxID=1917863 RepID=A0A2P2E594_9LEPT|nr:hypothetical protein [Leptospira ryugenii]GBF52055.1 hypothetical protein LPTSP4_35930 [Leptospira ryugenii]